MSFTGAVASRYAATLSRLGYVYNIQYQLPVLKLFYRIIVMCKQISNS